MPAYLLCSTLPVQWLAYYPFRNMLRFPKAAVVGLISVSIMVKLVLCFLFISHGGSAFAVEYLFLPIHLAIYLVNIRVQPFKLVFTYLLLTDYLMMVRGTSAFAAVGLWGTVHGSLQESAVCLLLFAVTFPAMIRFFQNASRRVYRISAPIWKTIWMVPAFTSAVVLFFTRDLSLYTVRQWPFLLTRLGLLLCVFAVYYILLQSLENFQKQAELTAQKAQMERVLVLQKEQYALLKKQDGETRRFRHDLRQRLVAARHYLKEGQTEKLSAYLDALLGELPSGTESVCPNEAVNAVALYHQAAARRAGISSVSLRLEQVPANCSPELEGDLCALVGNLLENAVAACRDARQPFISMHSRYADGILTLAMDNRFSAVNQALDGEFLSTRPGGGMGLLSIRSIAEAYGGGCRFQTEGNVFSSSVYLCIPSETANEIPDSLSLR